MRHARLTYIAKLRRQNRNRGRFFFRVMMCYQLVKSEVSETTELLLDWANGNPAALDALTPRIYKELRRMAGGFTKRERNGQTLEATALVHELYIKLIDVRQVDWKGRAHFFAACAQIMRRILVDAARKRSANKHGGGLVRFNVDEVLELSHSRDSRLVALDDALNELQEVDPRRARIVELRYFGGLSVEETAAALGVSVETVTRDWRLARGWLLSEISVGGSI
jgi:RNA polymerase sigma factor (TIGR02999 family)